MAVERAVTEIINGKTWVCGKFTTSSSIKYFVRLTKLGGEAFAVISEYTGDDAIQKAVSLLVQNLDKDDVNDLIKGLLSNTTVDGQPINYDLEFMGDLGTLFKVLKFVVGANYGSFLAASGIQESV